MLREEKAPAPGEQASTPEPSELASEAQRKYVDSLMDDGGHVRLDRGTLQNLSKDRASELISDLKAGKYDREKWDVPF